MVMEKLEDNTMTSHAIFRAVERAGLNHSSSERFISKAIEKGKLSADFRGYDRRYLQNKEAKGQCETRVYSSFIFIVDTAGCCVTVYPAPDWFGKKKHFDGKIRISKPKKYARYILSHDEDAA